MVLCLGNGLISTLFNPELGRVRSGLLAHSSEEVGMHMGSRRACRIRVLGAFA